MTHVMNGDPCAVAARSVLCFGDSNTHGYVPGSVSGRFNSHVRWPGVMRELLGPRWLVIEEGLPGRTAKTYPGHEHVASAGYLAPCLQSHAPIDAIVLMLGTNDLQAEFAQTPAQIAAGIVHLIKMVRTLTLGLQKACPEILIVAPPPMRDDLRVWQTAFVGAPEKSQRMAKHLRSAATKYECEFFDAKSVAECHEADGLHLGAAAHIALGIALASILS